MTAVPPDDVVGDLRQFPWLAMLLAKWALLDKMVLLEVGERLSQERLGEFINELWNFDSDLIKQPRPSTAHLLIRPRVFVQMEFQRGSTRSFVRIPALISRLPVDHSLRKLFQTQWELTPEQFIDLAVALYMARIQDNKPGFSRSFFDPLVARYGNAAIDRILSMLSRDLLGLRQELAASESLGGGEGIKNRRRSELLEFPYFKRFPLFRAPNDVYFVWHPTVLARALEDAVHLRLSEAGEAYTKPFSRIFERYVVDLATAEYPQTYTEADIKCANGPSSVSVEAVVPFEHCNVLLEAKMGLYRDEVMTLNTPELVRHKFRDLRKAVAQGATVAEMLHTGVLTFERILQTKVNYLLVVTSRDLCIGRGDVLDAMCQPNAIEYMSETSRQLLPLEHVFYVSIEAFESILAAVRAGRCSLPELLAQAVEANRIPSTASYWLNWHMSKQAQAVEDEGTLMAVAWESSLTRLAVALGGDNAER